MAKEKHDVVARPVSTGDFVQLVGWFDDVWSYVTGAHGVRESTQLITHSRRDKRGVADRDHMDVVGTSICRTRGSLICGMDTNRLRRVATSDEMLATMAAGSPLIVAMPSFKLSWWEAWADGAVVGRLDRQGMVHIGDHAPFRFDDLDAARKATTSS